MNANIHTTIATEIKPVIMQDKGAWQFTDEQIVRLKKHETAVIAEFYNSNYRIFLGMARKFVWKQKYLFKHWLYDVDDCMQQVFVDLPYYDFSSRCNLYYCIVYGTFLMSNDGGITTLQNKVIKQSLMFSYDTPLNGTDGKESCSYVLDRLASSPSPYEVLTTNEDREIKDNEICAFLERTIKNKRYINAMFCQLFTDIPLNQIRGDEYEYYKQCKNQVS